MNPNAKEWNPPPGMAIPNILGNRNGYANNSYSNVYPNVNTRRMEEANNMRIPNIVNNGNTNFKNMMNEINKGRQQYLVNEPLSRKNRKSPKSRKSRKTRKSRKSRKSRKNRK